MESIYFQASHTTKEKLKALAKRDELDLGTFIRFSLVKMIRTHEEQSGAIEINKKAK